MTGESPGPEDPAQPVRRDVSRAGRGAVEVLWHGAAFHNAKPTTLTQSLQRKGSVPDR
jgi:hypothetical protein